MNGGSVDLVGEELDRFLTDPTSDVLAISGDWGSGKTFAWEAALKRLKDDPHRKIARPSYAYVSLFGVGNLAQLKLAIFQNSEATTSDTNKKQKMASSGLRELASRLRLVPGVGDYADAAEELMALEVRDRIVCFDDLERMSPDLHLSEVLGLASFLKERRNCKIVFIAHTDKLQEKDEFEKLSEKVVDISLRFVRPADSSAGIAISDQTPLAEMTRDKCIALGITNIRVIRQIWRMAKVLEEKLKGYDQRILKQGIHSLVLFAWCHLQPKIAPDKEFVRTTRTAIAFSANENTSLTPEQRGWGVILDAYEFAHADEFDAVVFSGVEHGYFDMAALRVVADQKNALAISEQAGSSVQDAWSTFHHSFAGTEKSVATAIHAAVKKHARFVTPMNLDGAVRILKELGYSDLATDLLNQYIADHSAETKIFDLDNYVFSDEMKDPDVINAFNWKFQAIPDSRDPLDVMISVSKNGMTRADFSKLDALSVEELITIFKKAGSDTRRVINACMDVIPPKPTDEPSVAQRARQALIRIGRESPLNRLRIKRFGISDDELDGDS
ncbi:MAG: hypothetical protein R3C31_06490 [Hyphomonadaceae bacterium]